MEGAALIESAAITESLKDDSVTVHAGGDAAEANESDDSTAALFMKEVTGVLEELEGKREGDKRIIEEFQMKMNEMVEEMCNHIQQQVTAKYGENNSVIQAKLEYLNQILEKITVLEQELNEFNSAVNVFFQRSPVK